LLKRNAPGGRRIEQLVSELRSSAVAIGQGLQRLEQAGLIVHSDDEYRYGPVSPVLASLAEDVERAYALKPVWLVNVILSAKNEHLQAFANSFRLKE
jgi:hypothetical protein